MKHLLTRLVLPVIALAALTLPADGQQIKRWVDSRGAVHYGDTPPADAASSPVTGIAPARPLTAAEKAQAEQDMRKYRQALAQQPASAPAAAAPAPQASALPQDDSCASQWARYNAAYACMNPYRMSRGAIRPEAFEKCPQLPQPNCSPPP